jgi:hypothetical protein
MTEEQYKGVRFALSFQNGILLWIMVLLLIQVLRG